MVTDRRAEWLKGVDAGFISEHGMVQWSTEIDGRECETCRELAESQTELRGAFPYGDPPIHEGCRCCLLLVPEEIDSEIQAMSDQELDGEIGRLLTKRPGWRERFAQFPHKRPRPKQL